MAQIYTSGVIPAGGIATVNVGGWKPNFTATLISTAAGRQIAFTSSPFASPPAPVSPDITTANWINYAFDSAIYAIQFTGNPGDPYEVR